MKNKQHGWAILSALLVILIAPLQASVNDNGIYSMRVGASVPNTYDEFGFDRNGKDRDGNSANDAPVITSFTATPNSGTLPIQVTFTVNVTDDQGTPSLSIAYGDGQTGTGLTHNYTTITGHPAIVTVTATDAGGKTAQSSLSLALDDPTNPITRFDFASSVAAFQGGRASFALRADDPSFITQFSINPGDGSPVYSETYTLGAEVDSINRGHVIYPQVSGNYTAVATVTNGLNETYTSSFPYTIAPAPLSQGCFYTFASPMYFIERTDFTDSRPTIVKVTFYGAVMPEIETEDWPYNYTYTHDDHGMVTIAPGVEKWSFASGSYTQTRYEACISY